ncbi:MAG: hypothetical protein IPO40_22335 [Fibrobacteres bacterium]|nr:hypothetical protein [Fibrobacterota bacterium]
MTMRLMLFAIGIAALSDDQPIILHLSKELFRNSQNASGREIIKLITEDNNSVKKALQQLYCSAIDYCGVPDNSTFATSSNEEHYSRYILIEILGVPAELLISLYDYGFLRVLKGTIASSMKSNLVLLSLYRQ